MTSVDRRMLDEIAQGLRKAHCSRGDDANHECVGTCTVTRDGVELACKLCGSQSEPIAPSELLPATRLAMRVLAAAGLEWSALTPERRRAAALAAGRSPS